MRTKTPTQTTLKVSQATYDKVKALADESDESLGSVADTLLSDAVNEFQNTVDELTARSFTKEELLDRIPGVAKGADKGADTGIKEVDVDGKGFECAACAKAVRRGDKHCGSCGQELDWARQGEAGKDGGSGKVVLAAVLIAALVTYNRYQKAVNQAQGGSLSIV